MKQVNLMEYLTNIKLLKEKFHFKKIVMVGDGATDMEACPPAVCIKHAHFYAACENETKTCITIKQKNKINKTHSISIY